MRSFFISWSMIISNAVLKDELMDSSDCISYSNLTKTQTEALVKSKSILSHFTWIRIIFAFNIFTINFVEGGAYLMLIFLWINITYVRNAIDYMIHLTYYAEKPHALHIQFDSANGMHFNRLSLLLSVNYDTQNITNSIWYNVNGILPVHYNIKQ